MKKINPAYCTVPFGLSACGLGQFSFALQILVSVERLEAVIVALQIFQHAGVGLPSQLDPLGPGHAGCA